MLEVSKAKFQTDILKAGKPAFIFYFDLDAIAGEYEEYELVWNKIEMGLLTVLDSFSRSENKAVMKQSFYLWGQLGTTVNADSHLCNAYFIYLISESGQEQISDSAIIGIEEVLTKVFRKTNIAWGIEEQRTLDEECIPLFKYEQGGIIHYVFDQIAENGKEDLGCPNVTFLCCEHDWHICQGAYSIDMTTDKIGFKLTNGKTVSVQYRKFTIQPSETVA